MINRPSEERQECPHPAIHSHFSAKSIKFLLSVVHLEIGNVISGEITAALCKCINPIIKNDHELCKMSATTPSKIKHRTYVDWGGRSRPLSAF